MSNVKSKQVGTKFQGYYQYGCYWFPVKRRQRVVSFGSREAARAAAEKSLASLRS